MQEEALDIIEDWTDNIDMANNFYVLGGYQALRLCLKSPHNSLVAGSMNAIGVIAQNNPLSQGSLQSSSILLDLYTSHIHILLVCIYLCMNFNPQSSG